MSYANIRGKSFQAEGNSSWEAWEIQACLQCLKKNLNETWRAVWPKQGEGGREKEMKSEKKQERPHRGGKPLRRLGLLH